MSFQLNTRSINNLKGVKPELAKLMREAIVDSPYGFVITQGLRTLEEQKVLFKLGKSKTMKSRHLTGDAVDIAVLVDGQVTWDLKYYKQVATHVKKVAKGLGIRITWGGDWVSFIDGPHFQLEP
jgi:peptidoglycan L-alanyl-D-glutamate endopeptidase CwlK